MFTLRFSFRIILIFYFKDTDIKHLLITDYLQTLIFFQKLVLWEFPVSYNILWPHSQLHTSQSYLALPYPPNFVSFLKHLSRPSCANQNIAGVWSFTGQWSAHWVVHSSRNLTLPLPTVNHCQWPHGQGRVGVATSPLQAGIPCGLSLRSFYAVL